jgi:hypothetical protein
MYNIKYYALSFLVVIFCMASKTAFAGTWESRALALAVPVSAKIVSESDLASGVSPNQVFEVRLKNIDPIHGAISEKTADVILLATSKEAILSRGKIFVFVSTTSAHKIRSVLYWGELNVIACVPKQIVDGTAEKDDFSTYTARPDASCINAEWFR